MRGAPRRPARARMCQAARVMLGLALCLSASSPARADRVEVRLDEAIEMFRETADNLPNNVLVRQNLIATLIHAERQEEAIGRTCAFAEGKVTRVAVENMGADERASVADIADLLRSVEGCDVGMCLDTGHACMSGQDVAAFVREAGDKLIATHVTDCATKKKDHFMPFSAGRSTGLP